MSHLDIIKEAYDKCGIEYIIRTSTNNPSYQYLFLAPDDKAEQRRMTRTNLDCLLGSKSFLEFYMGEIASY